MRWIRAYEVFKSYLRSIKDPLLAQTRSAYGYEGGDPVNRSDPTGLCPGPGSSCPQWLKNTVQLVGWGDVIRFIRELNEHKPTSTDAKGTENTVALNAATSILSKYFDLLGWQRVAKALALKEGTGPLSVIATIIDGACTTLERNNRLHRQEGNATP